jgi:protein SCO1/2
MRHKAILIRYFLLFLVLLLSSACTGGASGAPDLKGTVYEEPRPTPQFSLQNAAGETVTLEDYRGKVVPIYFGYTFCPDVCPLTMANLARVQSELDDDGEQMQVLMITVDPQRDSATVVQEYVQSFHPTFTGLSGTEEQIAAAADPFGVFFQAAEGSAATGYLVDHTARIFVIDKSGDLRVTYAYDAPVEDIAADMRALIAE